MKYNSWMIFFKPFIPILCLILIFGITSSAILEVNYFKQISSAASVETSLETDLYKNEINSQVSDTLYLADIVSLHAFIHPRK